MAKTNKELAVELLGQYLQGIYSRNESPMKAIDSETLAHLLHIFYEAVNSLPEK